MSTRIIGGVTLQGRKGDLIKAKGLRPGAPSQSWVGPSSLSSLLQAVRSAKSNGQSVRLVGGNTGPGVYKDWPVDIDVLIGTTAVKELTGITSREVCPLPAQMHDNIILHSNVAHVILACVL